MPSVTRVTLTTFGEAAMPHRRLIQCGANHHGHAKERRVFIFRLLLMTLVLLAQQGVDASDDGKQLSGRGARTSAADEITRKKSTSRFLVTRVPPPIGIRYNPVPQTTRPPPPGDTPFPTAPPTLAPQILSSTTSPAPEPMSQPQPPSFQAQTVIFYVLGDLPYSDDEAAVLQQQMDDLPDDAEFVVHVGDIRSGRGLPECLESEYTKVADLLRRSHAPVFIVRGDNDWIDCPNPQEGYQFWKNSFSSFQDNWSHPFSVTRGSNNAAGRGDDNFSFVHKNTLFVGLCMVGGGGDDESNSEWSDRLAEQADWTVALVQGYQNMLQADSSSSSGAPVVVGRVVLFGHVDPDNEHDAYFTPLVAFIADALDNTIPILYMNGHVHQWGRDDYFFGQSSFMRITVSGQAEDPPVKMMVHSTGTTAAVEDAFSYDRRL
jgi:hypothetical protein